MVVQGERLMKTQYGFLNRDRVKYNFTIVGESASQKFDSVGQAFMQLSQDGWAMCSSKYQTNSSFEQYTFCRRVSVLSFLRSR